MTGLSSLRVSFIAVIALLSVSTISTAQDKLLPPTYQVGKTYDFEMTQDMTMDMTAMGQAMGAPGLAGKTVIKMTMGMTFACTKHTTPGQRAVAMRFSHVKMDMTMGPMTMAYDSSDPNSASSPLAASFKPLMDMEIVTILDENDKVVEVQGLDQLEGMQQFDADQMKQLSDPAAQLGIPATGVALGHAWENVMEMPMGKQIGKLKIKLNLKYEKDEVIDGVNCAVVNYTGTMDMNLNAGEATADGPAPQMKVEAADMKGTMKFDKANRMIKEGSAEGTMNLTMPNPKGGDDLVIPAEFKQTFEMKSVTSS